MLYKQKNVKVTLKALLNVVIVKQYIFITNKKCINILKDLKIKIYYLYFIFIQSLSYIQQ